MTTTLVVYAHAKINLGLEVLGRRPDGLHEVVTILQRISLADRLTFTPAPELALRCRGMRTDPDNLILRAAHLLRQHTGRRTGCRIECLKRIPIAAGLGGGSADAAATLLALNEVWECRLGRADLRGLAGQLGADVPFALGSGTALASGTGRTLAPLPSPPRHWVVVVPIESRIGNKTAEMYGSLTTADYTDGAASERQAASLRAGALDCALLANAFLRHAAARWPAVGQAIELLAEAGALGASLAGAGPSVYGLFGSRTAALAGQARLRAAGHPALLCHLGPDLA